MCRSYWLLCSCGGFFFATLLYWLLQIICIYIKVALFSLLPASIKFCDCYSIGKLDCFFLLIYSDSYVRIYLYVCKITFKMATGCLLKGFRLKLSPLTYRQRLKKITLLTDSVLFNVVVFFFFFAASIRFVSRVLYVQLELYTLYSLTFNFMYCLSVCWFISFC